MSERWRDILLIVALCAIVAMLFWPARNVEFLVSWDDDVNVTDNPFLHKGVSDGLAPLLTRQYQNLYVPATYAAYWAEFHLWGLNAYDFRVVNVFVHAANVALLFLIFRRMLPGMLLPWAAALWWGAHPLNVEPVAWVTGLKDVLSAFFMLLSFRYYMGWREASPPESASRARGLWIASLISFMLACLAKPGAVAFPVVLGCYDLFVARRNWRKLGAVIPYFVFSAVIVAVTMSAQVVEKPGLPPPPDLVGRLRVVGDTLVFYLGKLAWPSGLCAVYGRTVDEVTHSGWSWACLAGVFAICAIAWRLGERWRMGVAIYIAGLAPVSGIVPFIYQRDHSTVADRYVYFSAAGAALILADVVARFGFSAPKRMNKCGAAGCVILLVWAGALGVATRRQVSAWASPIAMWQREVDVKPNVAEGWCSLGVAWGMKGDIHRAIADCKRSVELDPRYTKGYGNLGVAYSAPQVHRYDLAIENCNRATALDPSFADAYYSRAVAYCFLKQYDKAWADVRQCRKLNGKINPDFLKFLERQSGRVE